MNKLKVAVSGSRSITDEKIVRSALDTFLDQFRTMIRRDDADERLGEIIHGGADGVDKLADCYLQELGYVTRAILPDYKRFGRGAPLKRDEIVVDECDLLFCIWDGVSRGTKYTFTQAQKKNKKTFLCLVADKTTLIFFESIE